jgi:hypothetical protein
MGQMCMVAAFFIRCENKGTKQQPGAFSERSERQGGVWGGGDPQDYAILRLGAYRSGAQIWAPCNALRPILLQMPTTEVIFLPKGDFLAHRARSCIEQNTTRHFHRPRGGFQAPVLQGNGHKLHLFQFGGE